MYVTPYLPGPLSSGPGPGSDTMICVCAVGFTKLSFCDCHSLNAANCAACLAVLALTVISVPLIGLNVNSISFPPVVLFSIPTDRRSINPRVMEVNRIIIKCGPYSPVDVRPPCTGFLPALLVLLSQIGQLSASARLVHRRQELL